MTKVDENIKSAQNLLSGIVERCHELEEENKKLKEEVKDLVERNIELNKKYMLVLTENKKLKEKLEQIKETYIRFEDSEKEYNKGLGELDQLIMNR